MSVVAALFGPGAMSGFHLFCAPKQRSADQSELMGSRPGWVAALRCAAKRRRAASGTRGMYARRGEVICPSGSAWDRWSRSLPVNIVARTRRFVVLSQADLGRPVPSAKIFRFTRRANHLYKFAPSHPTRGAYHDRHERGVGCGGRGSVLRATGLQGG
jgi:hypothetical protein